MFPGHSMLPQEEAIMDLYDAGLSLEEIGDRLNLSAVRVRQVTRTMCEGRPDRWALRVPAASAQLAAAIARMGA